YIGLVRPPAGSSYRSREREVSEISNGFKALALELKIPIVVVSQLNRSCEARRPPRPLLSDLRESGSLEQDADIVALVYREDYYTPTERPGIAEVIIAKHRNGRTGSVELRFDGATARFDDV
ncbi:MAG: DnaB-like helicase C-terminal domain-containing protein, partial [Chloroflexi bacterium]|nr:DnaB-like helicase C-terminal domain-containing protein [Chloroflexota bacterium]